MRYLLSLLLLAAFSGLSAQTIFNTLYNEIEKSSRHIEKTYNEYPSSRVAANGDLYSHDFN